MLFYETYYNVCYPQAFCTSRCTDRITKNKWINNVKKTNKESFMLL